MDLLTANESREFPLRNVAQEGEEVMSANEIDKDPEGEPHNSPQQRRKRPRGKQESRPRKRRRVDETAVAEERWRRAALLELRSPNSRARSKMKAMRLILEEYSNTESRAAASRGCPTQEAGTEANTVREKEAPAGNGLQTSEVRSTPVKPSRATKKYKGKVVLT